MNWTASQWIALTPILITAATIVVVMMAIAIRRHHRGNIALCVIGLSLALLSCIYVWLSGIGSQMVTPLLQVDHYALFYMGLILAITLACTALAQPYLEGYQGNREELYLLMLLATLGGLVLVCASNFVSFFLGLELLSIPLYGMIAYPHHRDRRALEGGIKYLVLSAVASSFIVFGMALIYARTGTLSFQSMAPLMASAQSMHDTLLLAGGGMILVGIGFEVALVPFHLWTPDVYEGAPAPVTAWLSTAAKVAMFALLLRFFVEAGAYHSQLFLDILTVLAVLSMVIGNVLALQQTNLKRLLAYSAIAHFGYILVAFIATGALAVEAVGVYLLTYAVTELAAFGVISLMSSPLGEVDADELFDYRGLFWRRPYLSSILTLSLLSLAGVPLTAGFMGKFYAAAAGIDARLWLLLAMLVLGSAIGLFYYLRAMVVLFLRPRWVQPFQAPQNWGTRAGGIAMLATALAILWLGIYPAPAINMIKAAGLAVPVQAPTISDAAVVTLNPPQTVKPVVATAGRSGHG